MLEKELVLIWSFEDHDKLLSLWNNGMNWVIIFGEYWCLREKWRHDNEQGLLSLRGHHNRVRSITGVKYETEVNWRTNFDRQLTIDVNRGNFSIDGYLQGFRFEMLTVVHDRANGSFTWEKIDNDIFFRLSVDNKTAQISYLRRSSFSASINWETIFAEINTFSITIHFD